MKPSLVFMGTPDFSVPILDALLKCYDVRCVYTQPPRPAGRGHKTLPSPVHAYALSKGIPVRHPLSFRESKDIEDFRSLGCDLAVVVAYGLILPKAILEAPTHGCLNIHASLLPRWRGAAPIQRAIEAGDRETGITLMQMDEGLDTGPMIKKASTPITAETTAKSLHDTLSSLGANLLMATLPHYLGGQITPRVQPQEGITYAEKLQKQEGLINWQETAETLLRKLKAFTPFPGLWFMHQGRRIKVLDAHISPHSSAKSGTILMPPFGIACKEGIFHPDILQREGSKPLPINDFLRGYAFSHGEILE